MVSWNGCVLECGMPVSDSQVRKSRGLRALKLDPYGGGGADGTEARIEAS